MRKLLCVSGLVGCLMLPMSVMANDLTISNHTNSPITSIINNGFCSTILGAIGITQKGETNTIDSGTINKACLFNKTNCKAEIHMSNNCSGPVVANVYFDVSTGVKSDGTQLFDSSYLITGSGFTIMISGGPSFG